MNNCIIINNQKIDLTEEQVEKIVAAYNTSSVKLSDIAEGGCFKIGNHELVLLELFDDTAAVILKDSLPERTTFGSNNKYDGSNPDQACCEFAGKLTSLIGSENLVPHSVDLISNDGLKDYGQVERAVSLLTADQYRRYVRFLDKFKPDEWWWLATPWSTTSHENSSYVLCVSPSGLIDYRNCNRIGHGVRPFCILKSNIFVSK